MTLSISTRHSTRPTTSIGIPHDHLKKGIRIGSSSPTTFTIVTSTTIPPSSEHIVDKGNIVDQELSKEKKTKLQQEQWEKLRQINLIALGRTGNKHDLGQIAKTWNTDVTA
ncbi:hypothetical protein L2E82_43883 [Cichorium intybus]|uniref:Uncharacterized protein n=1 Tax=Cichorium intybus TaxID=13427 RepID=A0ACB8ZPV0_CICIN|nr:hypothetical protein L2E82_43883 [Cichorium intybus]